VPSVLAVGDCDKKCDCDDDDKDDKHCCYMKKVVSMQRLRGNMGEVHVIIML